MCKTVHDHACAVDPSYCRLLLTNPTSPGDINTLATATKKPTYRHEGKKYDLRVEDVADVAGRAPRWVYVHAAALGGLKKKWDGNDRQTIRFPSVGLKSRLKALAVL